MGRWVRRRGEGWVAPQGGRKRSTAKNTSDPKHSMGMAQHDHSMAQRAPCRP